jgi:phage shock protein A
VLRTKTKGRDREERARLNPEKPREEFLASITGKKKEFEKQAEKEEADWVSAEKWYAQSQAALQSLEQEGKELKRARAVPEKEVQTHIDAQNSLESLY